MSQTIDESQHETAKLICLPNGDYVRADSEAQNAQSD